VSTLFPAALGFHFVEGFTPLWIALAIVLIVAAVRYYPRRLASADRSTMILLALRVGAIALVLMLLLDPILALVSDRTVPARIALLLDGSLSMSIPFPNDAPVDEAAASAPGASATPGTRASRMNDALEDGLLQDIRGKGQLDAYRFGASLAPVAVRDDSVFVEPVDDRTDLSRALSDGVGALRRRTGAIVLMSDGSHNVGADPRRMARRLGVPVFAIGIGNEGPISDLSIVDVEASSVSYLDNDVPVRAKIRARGDALPGVPVYLSEGEVTIDSVLVDLPGAGAEIDVEMHYTPTEEGVHRYRVWTPAKEGEVSSSNNERLIAVRVLKEKIRVLLLASRPSFDFTFLKRALASDLTLQVDAKVLSLASFPGVLGKKGPPTPDAYAELATYDLIALVDAGVKAIGVERMNDLARFVTERGGALLIMGTTTAFDAAGTDLADLLPVVPAGGSRSRTGQILPRLTISGETHPITQLDPDPSVNRRLWNELPPLGEVPLFIERRPEAHVLVEGELDGARREELPLVATMQHGRGRVLTLAGSPYWRWDLYLWGTGRSGDAFRRFVSRSVRWLVSRDELKQVMIRPEKSLFEGAETVVLEGQLFDDDFRPIEGADVHATVNDADPSTGAPREISLVDLGGGRYRGMVAGLPPGDYHIDGSAKLGGAELGADSSEMSVAPYQVEFEDPAPDFALLREVARESGGRFLSLAEAGELPDLLRLDPVVDRSIRELPFLENPLFFLALLGLLGAEWALRRRRGLP
jgi:hypothetical protein